MISKQYLTDLYANNENAYVEILNILWRLQNYVFSS
jgi:hypothetical protein